MGMMKRFLEDMMGDFEQFLKDHNDMSIEEFLEVAKMWYELDETLTD